MGDFNLKGYEEKVRETNECAMYRQLFQEELFMRQFVTEPTREHSILDLVFSDKQELVKDLTIGEGFGNSDHNTITFQISSEVKPNDNFLKVPNFNQADFKNMRKALGQVDWNNEFVGLDACEAWNRFKIILKRIQNRYIPLKQRRNRRKQNPLWLTPVVRNAIRNKRETLRLYKRSSREDNKRIYQKCRNEVKRKIRAAKREKELDLARNCNADSKKFFSFYRLSNGPKSIGPLKVHDTVVSEDNEMVKLFSDQFKSVFTIEDTADIESLQSQPLTGAAMGEIDNINSELVRTYLRKIRSNKAEGPDGIYAKILNECEREIAEPLASIFSKSLSETKIPPDWKRAHVVPIFKGGDKSNVENYRPVSLTSLVCKTLESIIKDRIVEFLDENDLIRDSQHGFRKNRSCLTNLLEFFDMATESFDRGKQFDVAYLDFSKAFDKVPHKRLCLQLKCHGINGEILEWIENWLLGRQQRVLLNGCRSEWKEVLSGVPQGSVLGPLLFLIFVNSIEDGVKSAVLKFADDLKVFRTIESAHDQEVFQSDLNRLLEWSEKWQMKFNLSKCKTMHIGRLNHETLYEMDGQRLSQIKAEKDLGVIVNRKLSASEQVNEARKRALKMLGAINRNVSYRSEEVITKLYCAYVRPHLEYCVQAWCPMYEKDCWLLERVQKRATKMIKTISNLDYEKRLQKLDMFSLRYRRLRGDLIEVFKFANGQHIGYLKGMFDFSTETRGRCHKHKLVTKQSRTRLRQEFFSRRVVGNWNKLPESVTCAVSLESFKIRLDKYFVDKGLAYKYKWD